MSSKYLMIQKETNAEKIEIRACHANAPLVYQNHGQGKTEIKFLFETTRMEDDRHPDVERMFYPTSSDHSKNSCGDNTELVADRGPECRLLVNRFVAGVDHAAADNQRVHPDTTARMTWQPARWFPAVGSQDRAIGSLVNLKEIQQSQEKHTAVQQPIRTCSLQGIPEEITGSQDCRLTINYIEVLLVLIKNYVSGKMGTGDDIMNINAIRSLASTRQSEDR